MTITLTCRENFRKVCNVLKLKFHQVMRRVTIRKLIKKYPTGNFFCIERGHAFAVIDGVTHMEDNLNNYLKDAWKIEKINRL